MPIEVQDLLDAIASKDTSFIDDKKNFNAISALLKAEPGRIVSVLSCLIDVANRYQEEENNFENLLYFFDKLRSVRLELYKKSNITYALAAQLNSTKLLENTPDDAPGKLMLLVMLATELRWGHYVYHSDHQDDYYNHRYINKWFYSSYTLKNTPKLIEKVYEHAIKADLEATAEKLLDFSVPSEEPHLNPPEADKGSQTKKPARSIVSTPFIDLATRSFLSDTAKESLRERVKCKIQKEKESISSSSSASKASKPAKPTGSVHSRIIKRQCEIGKYDVALRYVNQKITDPAKRKEVVKEVNNSTLTQMYNESLPLLTPQQQAVSMILDSTDINKPESEAETLLMAAPTYGSVASAETIESPDIESEILLKEAPPPASLTNTRTLDQLQTAIDAEIERLDKWSFFLSSGEDKIAALNKLKNELHTSSTTDVASVISRWKTQRLSENVAGSRTCEATINTHRFWCGCGRTATAEFIETIEGFRLSR